MSDRTLEEKRDFAIAKRDAAQQSLLAAEARRAQARAMGGGLLGFGGSGNQRANKQVQSATSIALEAVAEADEKFQYWGHRVWMYETEIAERDRKRLTRDDIAGARVVKTANGWRAVKRVNRTSVSVETGYSWADRIPFDRVLAVKH